MEISPFVSSPREKKVWMSKRLIKLDWVVERQTANQVFYMKVLSDGKKMI